MKFVPESFSLDTNQSHSFLFGTVNLREESAHDGILESETDDLDVTARFQFTNPFGNIVQLEAKGAATTGSVSDDAVDLTIKWTPLEYAFGDGGLLWITLADLSFSTQGSLNQMATVALRASPREANNDVPEPASLALVGIALLGLGVARRRRR